VRNTISQRIWPIAGFETADSISQSLRKNRRRSRMGPAAEVAVEPRGAVRRYAILE
jgi:hypothetical protein